MAINFPDSPTPGDTFISGSTTFQWDGVVWRRLADETVLVTDVEPVTNIPAGKLWFDPTTSNLSVYFDGGAGLAWGSTGDGRYGQLDSTNTWNFRNSFTNVLEALNTYFNITIDNNRNIWFRRASDNTARALFQHNNTSNAFGMYYYDAGGINEREVAYFDDQNTTLSWGTSVVTRQKGDARYVAKAGDTMTGALSAPTVVTTSPGVTASFVGRASTNTQFSHQTEAGVQLGAYYFNQPSLVHVFSRHNADGTNAQTVARIENLGTDLPLDVSVVTREKGDARYLQTANVDQTISGAITFTHGTEAIVIQGSGAGNDPYIRFRSSAGDNLGYLQARDDGGVNGDGMWLVSQAGADVSLRLLDGEATIVGTGTDSPSVDSIITRERGDIRYHIKDDVYWVAEVTVADEGMGFFIPPNDGRLGGLCNGMCDVGSTFPQIQFNCMFWADYGPTPSIDDIQRGSSVDFSAAVTGVPAVTDTTDGLVKWYSRDWDDLLSPRIMVRNRSGATRTFTLHIWRSLV